ncbi:hypothetical protein RhiLY_14289 [Ceratobasidium sp. AG-Ba]|nr:hypothetical protein RhiLY_14289 [Ceratobasidium sp. AG-Ba]
MQAEQTIQAFESLKIKKQMNWESIKIRPDGTLVIVPSAQSDKFLISEEVWDLTDLSEHMQWPIKELVELLQQADKQGIIRNAVTSLRAYDGPWDRIAVWKIAKQIGLRPAEQQLSWFRYPPNDWAVHTGMIVAWEHEDAVSFDQLSMMPRQGLSQHDQAHLRRFMMVNAVGETEDGRSMNYRKDDRENWFERTPDGEWESFTLEHWKDLEWVQLDYESPRLDRVPWDQWKIILQSCAKRKNRKLDDLGIVTRTECSMLLHKRDCPELGTRPLYFHRRPNQVVASPREFWGFYSFNPDPNGSPGIKVRVSERGMGRVMSDSMRPMPRGWVQSEIEVEFRIVWVNMRDDWNNKIEYELEQQRLEPFAIYEENHIKWSDDEEDEMNDPGWQ